MGIVLAAAIYLFRDETPPKEKNETASVTETAELTIDSILHHAKESLSPGQVNRISLLEESVSRGDVKQQKLEIYHQLAHFWGDSARVFDPYAWYEAEGARLENSEKNLTFAAHLFLDNLRGVSNPRLRRWEALQAKDLFERSLKLNPDNDSSRVGLGACYLFGGISETPMEGINMILQVLQKDSTNVFAQMMLGFGSVQSGQYDKAVERFEKVLSVEPQNLEAILMLAEVYERRGEKINAAAWYEKALGLVQNENVKEELNKRIQELKK